MEKFIVLLNWSPSRIEAVQAVLWHYLDCPGTDSSLDPEIRGALEDLGGK